ncbi:predicted protein [Plenodomus lingam JN3]|uniref:Predicted protein n=1 Tax=Leptosphaeria maculans (strain JN3 / isolate v23.1.3 / race Av1-4-5-6-7-8) TaxID=985895 RepID=E4ZIS7_LEPMJ|nr:predicted protein [Plenodomus lingam JN3]CBX91098.1 predicted protein [Plenodomus lingam JN3]
MPVFEVRETGDDAFGLWGAWMDAKRIEDMWGGAEEVLEGEERV